MNRIVAALALLAMVPAMAAAAAGTDYKIVLEDVLLRPGVTADVAVTVFVSEDRPCNGQTALAVPGFAHTAATFAPLAEAVFDSQPAGHASCRIAAIDMPGHGESGLPEGALFGDLTLQDYTAAALAALEQLPTHGVRPTTIIAHSQGALVVQLAQQQLVAGGSSLREEAGVRTVVLLAPVPSAEVYWAFADSGAAAGVIGGFLAADAARGAHVAIPDPAWPFVFFSNLYGVLAPDAPSAPTVVAEALNAPEPLASALQLVGAFGSRLRVDAGIFSPAQGTALRVVTFEHDQLIRPSEGAAVYAHLTGDAPSARVLAVDGEFAVHDLYVSDPEAVAPAVLRN